MKNRSQRRVAARARWDGLRVNFWFVPVCMAVGALLLAWVMYWLDGLIPNEALASSRFVLAGTVDELRAYLLNIAATVLTTAGMVFTLITLPLSTVAAQYGSRLLRIYLADRTTQFVLGMFVATFVYCIAGALSVPSAVVQFESPQVTASVGLYLMLATFGSLILMVQHVSTMLQAPNIAAAAAAELVASVCEGPWGGVAETPTVATPQDRPADLELKRELPATGGRPVLATRTGYVQSVDPRSLMSLATQEDLVLHVLRGPGRFVCPEIEIARVWPVDRVDAQTDLLIQQAFRIGNGRTPTQDVEYAVNQLAEMAVRAMSSAINDPFTAMTCVDHMGHGLGSFLRERSQETCFVDDHAKVRLVVEPVMFGQLLSAAFEMLRHASCDNSSVLLHMLEVVDRISDWTTSPEERVLLAMHAQLIEAESQAGNLIERDRRLIQARVEALQALLTVEPSTTTQRSI